MKDRFKAYRMDKKFDSTSNDRVRKLALIDSIKAFVDKEVYDEVTAVRCCWWHGALSLVCFRRIP